MRGVHSNFTGGNSRKDAAGRPRIATVSWHKLSAALWNRGDGTNLKKAWGRVNIDVVPEIGIEPTTFALRVRCSTD